MPKTLTMQDLEQSVCGCGGKECENSEIWMHPVCHTGDGVSVRYTKGSGKLDVFCKTCQSFIVSVAVAQSN